MLKHPMPEEDGIHEDFATWLSVLTEVPLAYSVDEPLLIYAGHWHPNPAKKANLPA